MVLKPNINSHKQCPISILISKDRLLLAPDKSSFILKPTFMVTFFYNYNLVFFFNKIFRSKCQKNATTMATGSFISYKKLQVRERKRSRTKRRGFSSLPYSGWGIVVNPSRTQREPSPLWLKCSKNLSSSVYITCIWTSPLSAKNL